jgi:uncharacterized protein YdaU (DUF1376 family)
MHYYQFNIGDYAKHTHHLSLFEHMAYRLLLDRYYLNEKPLELDTKRLARLIGMASYHDEVCQVLEDFFVKTEDGFFNSRCDKEIKQYRAKADAARANGKKGGRPKKTEQEPKKTQPVSSANPTESESKANQEPRTNNHKPITNKKHGEGEPSSEPKVPPCPHKEIIQIYHEVLPELPKVIIDLWGGAREKQLRARWKQSKQHQSLDFWRWYFGIIRKSSFHLGDNERGWQADLGWLINPTNFAKMIGKYK